MSPLSQPDLSQTKTRRRSPGKLWLFRGLTVLVCAGLLELISLLAWQIAPPLRLDQFKENVTQVSRLGTDRKNDLEVLHPYVGWAFNPDASNIPGHVDDLTVNSLGFADTGPSLRKRSPDKLLVGVFGGSVAQQMTNSGGAEFRKRLESSPKLRGRQVEIVRLALSGFKQPQQIMALNYVLALGGEFDVIVNIDGFNEVALTVTENDALKVFLAYPRSWSARLQDVVDPRASSISYRLLGIRATRQARSRWMQTPLRYSWTMSFIWAAQDQILRATLLDLSEELIKFDQGHGKGFARQGPKQLYSNETEMYQQVTSLWANCSRQMHDLCAARGIPYLHCLQPNQYLEGSKPLSEKELDKFYAPHSDHALAIKRGYPELMAAGEQLRDSGIRFYDLTQLFAQEKDTIYSDYFCHYNAQGTNMLSRAVADEILAALPD